MIRGYESRARGIIQGAGKNAKDFALREQTEEASGRLKPEGKPGLRHEIDQLFELIREAEIPHGGADQVMVRVGELVKNFPDLRPGLRLLGRVLGARHHRHLRADHRLIECGQLFRPHIEGLNSGRRVLSTIRVDKLPGDFA